MLKNTDSGKISEPDWMSNIDVEKLTIKKK